MKLNTVKLQTIYNKNIIKWDFKNIYPFQIWFYTCFMHFVSDIQNKLTHKTLQHKHKYIRKSLTWDTHGKYFIPDKSGLKCGFLLRDREICLERSFILQN